MKGTRPILMLVLCLCLVACALEDEARWKILDYEAYQLFTKGKHEEGFTVAVQALDLAEKSFGPTDPKVATSLARLA
jgi:hypothetical protein